MRNLLEYLPPYVQEYKEIKGIMSGEQPEINVMWDNDRAVWDMQYILKLPIDGIVRWEKMIKITPKVDDSLDDRRYRILAYINASLPYTYRRLQGLIRNLTGDRFVTNLYPDKYHLYVKLGLENEKNISIVKELIAHTVPANLTFEVNTFNRHDMIKMRHEDMQPYTHFELRTENL